MALNGINFTLGQGGLGTPLPGSDFISGYLVYKAAAPSGFTLGVPHPVFSLSQAESLGIVGDYSDETAARGSFVIGAVASVGDVLTIKVSEPTINSGPANVVTLCSYTVLSTDNSTSKIATSLKNAINNNLTSGYTASVSSSTVTVIARPGMGLSLNTGTPLSCTESNAASPGVFGTVTQFTGGVGSLLAPIHYQVSEYFRIQPQGKLWIGFYAIPGSYTFTELNSIQLAASGEVRQFMVYSANGTSSTNINADLDAIQAVGVTMFNNYNPASTIYAPNIYAISDLTTLSNLRARSDNYASCVIGQDGGALGAWLSMTLQRSVPAMGACLGTVSLAAVEEDIAWVGKFNITNGTELEIPAFSNGNLGYNIPYNEQVSLDAYGYIFTIPKIGITGTFWNDSHCAILPTSDYAFIERNRVIGKAQRVIYQSLTPLENSPLYLNPNGTLSAATIRTFIDAIAPNMDQMVSAGEVSAYATTIDPTQNVQSTSTINISVKIVGVGVAREINVTLGFALGI